MAIRFHSTRWSLARRRSPSSLVTSLKASSIRRSSSRSESRFSASSERSPLGGRVGRCRPTLHGADSLKPASKPLARRSCPTLGGVSRPSHEGPPRNLAQQRTRPAAAAPRGMTVASACRSAAIGRYAAQHQKRRERVGQGRHPRSHLGRIRSAGPQRRATRRRGARGAVGDRREGGIGRVVPMSGAGEGMRFPPLAVRIGAKLCAGRKCRPARERRSRDPVPPATCPSSGVSAAVDPPAPD
jgi:hypothetical protein